MAPCVCERKGDMNGLGFRCGSGRGGWLESPSTQHVLNAPPCRNNTELYMQFTMRSFDLPSQSTFECDRTFMRTNNTPQYHRSRSVCSRPQKTIA